MVEKYYVFGVQQKRFIYSRHAMVTFSVHSDGE